MPAIAATVPATSVAALARSAGVLRVEPDGTVFAIDHDTTSADAELDNTWGVEHIRAGEAHASGNVGTGVKVAVIDSGVDYNHPDLAANYAGGYDFVNDDPDPMDDNSHGTHVAGTVAAVKDGVGVVGVAPSARIYALKVLGASGSGSWSDVIAALQWTVDNGIQVTNNSYSSGSDPGVTVQDAFDASYAAGVLHVAAAGNSGNCAGKNNSVGYPARYGSVIAIAATNESDSRACFSSTGEAVELAAPGVGVNSTVPGGGYDSFSGTSMASPHVAGTAALIIANGTTGPDAVRQSLRDTAKDIGPTGKDTHYGYGLVNAAVLSGPAPAPTTGSITGTVTDSATAAAIGGTTVSTDSGQSTTTAADGTYTLADVPTGTRTVTASASGYDSQSATAEVTDGGTTTVNFALSATTTSPDTVTVKSIDYTTFGGPSNDKHLDVTVSVVDASGQPVGGASVSIRLDNTTTGQSWSGTGTTDSTGLVTFSLKSAPGGCYTTTVTALTASGLTWDGTTPANGFCKG